MSSSVTNPKLTAWNYVVKFGFFPPPTNENKTQLGAQITAMWKQSTQRNKGGKQIFQSRNQKIYKNLKRKTIKPFKDPQLGSIEPPRHAVERCQLKHDP